jgi:hypothetical protein
LAGFRILNAVGNLCCHLLCFYFLLFDGAGILLNLVRQNLTLLAGVLFEGDANFGGADGLHKTTEETIRHAEMYSNLLRCPDKTKIYTI